MFGLFSRYLKLSSLFTGFIGCFIVVIRSIVLTNIHLAFSAFTSGFNVLIAG
jgi:hypothetical protein